MKMIIKEIHKNGEHFFPSEQNYDFHLKIYVLERISNKENVMLLC